MTVVSSRIVCIICLEDLNGPESQIVSLKCGHVFDRICLEQCLGMVRLCPICKSHVGFNESRRLYFSEGGDQSIETSPIYISLNETIEAVTCDLAVARELCSELTESLVEADNKYRGVELQLKGAQMELAKTKQHVSSAAELRESLVNELKAVEELNKKKNEKSVAEIEEVRRTFMGKIKDLEEENKRIINGLRKEIFIKEKLASDKIKKLVAEKRGLEGKLGRIRAEKAISVANDLAPPHTIEKEPFESTMERRFLDFENKLLEKMKLQVIGHQHSPYKQNNKHQQKNMQHNNKQQTHNKKQCDDTQRKNFNHNSKANNTQTSQNTINVGSSNKNMPKKQNVLP